MIVIEPEMLAAAIAAARQSGGESRARAYQQALASGAPADELLDILCGSHDSDEDRQARAQRSREIAATATRKSYKTRGYLVQRGGPRRNVLATVLRLQQEGGATVDAVCTETNHSPMQVRRILRAAGIDPDSVLR